MRLLFLAALLAACSAPEAPADGRTAGTTDRAYTGRVVSVDRSPMAFDGDALVDVQPDDGSARIVVHVPARQNLCAATIDGLGEVAPGDRVEVRGDATRAGTVTPCERADHVFRVVERASPSVETVRGVFESGFERSAFRPCDRPDEVWWLIPDDVLADEVDAIRQREAPDGGRGLRLFVEATVVGERREAGAFGHLGQYAHELRVTETRDVAYLGRDLDAPPACR